MKMYASVEKGSENSLLLQEMDRTVNVEKHSVWSPPGMGLLGCHPAVCQQVSHPVYFRLPATASHAHHCSTSCRICVSLGRLPEKCTWWDLLQAEKALHTETRGLGSS